QELPEISLLFFFQALIRKAYSYEFFLNAIEDVGEDILSNGDRSDEEKAYAMFFLSVILIDLECENPFDGLIESLEDKIPLPIQFGVHYESKNLKSHSSLLKRREKKLTHTLKHSSHELKSYLRKIHELPVAPSKKKINGK
ncbi:MAG: hypothetical protein Q8S39_02800, partial [Ignavibacteria bacterium]|nr:hypothetical protein [Ignavibacteria bacterium]